MVKHQETFSEMRKYASEHQLPVIPLCSHDHDGMRERHVEKCHNPGKVPLVKGWQDRGETLPEEIDNWEEKFPTANVGLVLGKPSCIIGIDEDGEGGKALFDEFCNGRELPETWTYITPGGGRRRLYKIPEGTDTHKYQKTGKGDHQGFELLGDGCQTALPPSIHKNGGVYSWEKGCSPDDMEIAAAPEWLLELMAEEKRNSSIPEDSHETDDKQTSLVLDTLKKKCRQFDEAYVTQANEGLDYDSWVLWVSLLVNSGNSEAASTFSTLSTKYDEESESHIDSFREDLGEEQSKGTTRCTKFGCGEGEICRCFGGSKLRFSDKGNPKNSPGAFITPHRLTKETELKAAVRAFDRVLQELKKGNAGAHMEESAMDAAAVIARNDIAEFARIRDKLKKAGAPLRDFLKNVRMRSGNDASALPALKPDNPIYESWLACLPEDSGFGINEDGSLYGLDSKGVPAKIGNFVARILEEAYLDDGLNEPSKEFFIIDGLLKGGIELSPIKVLVNEFQGMGWLLSKWSSKVIRRAGFMNDKLREAIQLFSKGASEVRYYSHLGWQQLGDSYCYLHAGGCIGNDNAKVQIDESFQGYRLASGKKDAAAYISNSFSLLEVGERKITMPLLSVTYLSAMCEFLRLAECEPKFVPCVIGKTGDFKTSLAMVFLSHFGDFEAPPASFKDTRNSIEKKAFIAKDVLLLIDDYHPTKSPNEAKSMNALFQYILRMYGDRISKGRMTPTTALQKQYPPRGLAIVTGEDFIDGESSVARALVIKTKKGSVNKAALSSAQKKQKRLKKAMYTFVGWLKDTMESTGVETLKEEFLNLRERATKEDQHMRLASTVAWLAIGLRYFCRFALAYGVINEAESESVETEGWEIFLGLANEQSKLVSAEDPVDQFIDILREMVNSKQVYTLSKNASLQNPQMGLPKNATHIGWQDKKYSYLFPQSTYSAVQSSARRRGEHFPISERTLWKLLAERGYIKVESEGNHIHPKVAIQGSRQRLVHLYKEALVDSVEDNDISELGDEMDSVRS